jgi:DNA-binding GntR family transcriptional regulator
LSFVADRSDRDALASLGRLGTATLHDRVYQRLAERLMAGAFRPGQTLSMQRLADALGTSTTPVREALRRLATNGAVEIQAKRAVRIPRMTRSRFDEIGQLRLATEGLAARYAAERISPSQLKSLVRLNEAMDRALAERAAEKYLEMNQAFHFCIYTAANAPVALSIIEGLWLQMGPVQGLYTETSVGVGSTAHARVLEALQQRNADAAAEALQEDIRIGIRLLAETSAFED